MTLSKEEWVAAVMAAHARMNAVGSIVAALNDLRESYDGDLDFYVAQDGRLEAAVTGCFV